MSAVEAEKNVEEEKEEVKGGELLFCGGTCWDIIGRRKGPVEGNLVSPTRLRPLVGIDIRFVASGCGEFQFLLDGDKSFAIRLCLFRSNYSVHLPFVSLSMQRLVIAWHWMSKGVATHGDATRHDER